MLAGMEGLLATGKPRELLMEIHAKGGRDQMPIAIRCMNGWAGWAMSWLGSSTVAPDNTANIGRNRPTLRDRFSRVALAVLPR